MAIVARPGLFRSARTTLGALLVVVALAHLAQAALSSSTDVVAGSVGAAFAYGVVSANVFLDQQWAYTAAVGLPFLAFFYSDHRITGVPTHPVEILYLCLYSVVIVLGVYLRFGAPVANHTN
ncbi:Uncharacterised protein (plasmid) [Tsukamurella tyrosinosolvens]|uniref:SPW repeat-containing protein n=1 Tax=Tsukamurella tyrosinosolvens TaxID=57704 RepID=A0A1H4ICN2_TSUTY|nr:hypothetical protein [Tsukamurella tyrosinosolvens]KXO98105.1 hypothetical protein AXK58_25790 [Tsukamurella tyrosinosolvens]SEB31690.1 hypothetical protein SAMN04489793_0251 [Tsukamurella tyrosinosolvens]VEH95025.1 Uncharacterised protein [Tsukamurella tyrosinosolvens]